MRQFDDNIDEGSSANLGEICRLCGMDQDGMVSIIEDHGEEDATYAPSLRQKILECIGIIIYKDDQMPQTICTFCLDKLNDFHQFRDMCYITNMQTRKLLGLKWPLSSYAKCKEPPKYLAQLEFLKSDEAERSKTSRMKSDISSNLNSTDNYAPKRKKVRLMESNAIQTKRKKSHRKSKSKIKKKSVCNICRTRFCSEYELESHLVATHEPSTEVFFCMSCNEIVTGRYEHDVLHRKTNTLFSCPFCDKLYSRFSGWSLHMKEHFHQWPATVVDRKCSQCGETFATHFLYNTHACALETKICAGCDQQLSTELEYMSHAAACTKMYYKYSTYFPESGVLDKECPMNEECIAENTLKCTTVDPLNSIDSHTPDAQPAKEQDSTSQDPFQSLDCDGNDSGIADEQFSIKQNRKQIKWDMNLVLSYVEICKICDEQFPSKFKLERHQVTSHVPNTLVYFCTTCNESMKKANEITNHQLWHKDSKTPHTCPLCDKTIHNFYTYSGHIRDHNMSVCGEATVLDRQCPQCREIFATNFLYNTHPCAVQTKICGGCDQQLSTERKYMCHAAVCPKIYHNYSTHISNNDGLAETYVKNENDVEAATETETHYTDEEYLVDEFLHSTTEESFITIDKYDVEVTIDTDLTVPEGELKEEPVDDNEINTDADLMPTFNKLCNICNEHFCSKSKLERHQATTHVPNTTLYFCTTCNQNINANEANEHRNWHNKFKIPHTCPLCRKTIYSFYSFSGHMRDHSVILCREATVLDRECPQCRHSYATHFLYNTHDCFVQTKMCAGCDRQLSTEMEYKRHAANCPKIYSKYSTNISDPALLAESCIEDKIDVEEASEDEVYTINDFDVNCNTDTTAISVKYEIERADYDDVTFHHFLGCDDDCYN